MSSQAEPRDEKPSLAPGRLPRHIAIIMDGNGRWAEARGLPRSAGHEAGADAVRRVVEAAPGLGIGTLTLYAFSSDNWRRPRAEVATLMRLFERYLVGEASRCEREGVCVNVIGRRDRLPRAVRAAIERTEAQTARGRTLSLRLAVDYSARGAIEEAARRWTGADTGRPFRTLIEQVVHTRQRAPDVDLMIRTSGEQRLSDFLLLESAYAELLFTPQLWPDFGPDDLAWALREYARRERRFGEVAHT